VTRLNIVDLPACGGLSHGLLQEGDERLKGGNVGSKK
jgi:hypothetical protein